MSRLLINLVCVFMGIVSFNVYGMDEIKVRQEPGTYQLLPDNPPAMPTTITNIALLGSVITAMPSDMWNIIANYLGIKTLTSVPQSGIVLNVSTKGFALKDSVRAISLDGNLVVVQTSDSLKVWDARTKTWSKTLKTNQLLVTCVCFSADMSTSYKIIAGTWQGKIMLWDITQGDDELEPVIVQVHSKPINTCACDASGAIIITGSQDRTACVSTLDAQNQVNGIKTFSHTASVASVTCTYDLGKIITATVDGKIFVWDMVTGKQVTLLSDINNISLMQSNGAGKIVCCDQHKSLVTIRDSHTLARSLALPQSSVVTALFSGDGQVVTGCRDGAVTVWDSMNGHKTLSVKHNKQICAVSLTGGDTLLVALVDGTLHSYNIGFLDKKIKEQHMIMFWLLKSDFEKHNYVNLARIATEHNIDIQDLKHTTLLLYRAGMGPILKKYKIVDFNPALVTAVIGEQRDSSGHLGLVAGFASLIKK